MGELTMTYKRTAHGFQRKIIISPLLIMLLASLFCLANSASSATYASTSGGSRFYGGAKDDGGYSIILTGDNGYAMAGYTESFGAGGSDAWLIRTALTTMTMSNNKTTWYQREQWNKTYGGPADDGAKSIIETLDGVFVLAGYTNSSIDTGIDAWLIKTDLNGEMQWNMTYGGAFEDKANCVIQTVDDGYLLAGYASPNNQTQSAWIVKTDVFGAMEWNQTYPGSSSNQIIKTNDGNYAFEVQYANAFGLIKIDPAGQILFSQTYPAPLDKANTQAIIQTDDGGYALAGSINDNSGTSGTWLIKTDPSGNIEWNQTYDKLGVNGLIAIEEGGYAMTGDRACLILTDSAGNVQWKQTYDGETGDGGEWFTEAYSIIETSPLHFSMIGVQNSTGRTQSYPSSVRNQLNLVEVALKIATASPSITVISPQNGGVYPADNVPLTFYVSNATNWMAYALDGPMNVTISGNTTLPALTEGPHNITVYAVDTSNTIGSSGPIYFTSETIYFEISASSQQTPTTNPTESSPTLVPGTPLFEIALIISAAVIAVAASLGIIFHLRARKAISQNP
jgi:hypothetical protein